MVSGGVCGDHSDSLAAAANRGSSEVGGTEGTTFLPGNRMKTPSFRAVEEDHRALLI